MSIHVCDSQTISNSDSSVGRTLSNSFRGQGSNHGFVHHYFSHPVAFGAVPTPGTNRLTPCQGKEPVHTCSDLRGR